VYLRLNVRKYVIKSQYGGTVYRVISRTIIVYIVGRVFFSYILVGIHDAFETGKKKKRREARGETRLLIYQVTGTRVRALCTRLICVA